MFKVAGPFWAQATAGGDNVFARLAKTGKKLLKRVLKKREIETTQLEGPKPTWSLRSHTVKVDSTTNRLIGGLFPKQALETQAAELRRQAALRLVRDSRKVPVFAFVGLSLGVGASYEQKTGSTEDVLYAGIRELFQHYGGKGRVVEEGGQHFSLQTLQLGPLIGQGCNAAVFEARATHTQQSEDKNEREEAEISQPDSSVDQMPETVENQPEPAAEAGQLNGGIHPTPVTTAKSVSNDDTEEEDDISIISEEDSDFCIIGEEEEEEEEEEESRTADENLDGWVLYRLSSVRASASQKSTEDEEDSDNDIIILAGDEGQLQSLPDLDDLASEFKWSTLWEAGSDMGVRVGSADIHSEGSATSTTSVSMLTNLSSDSNNLATEEPEPAPNIGSQEERIAVDREFPLAVKMMYNYNVESKADHIYRAMAKETIPALSHLSEIPGLQGSSLPVTRRLPPHPNIVTMYDVFVDQTPDLPEGQKLYPSALPPRLNKDGGFGRNATMFLVMKKYSMTLNEFLAMHTVDTRTRCMLFAQLLEGVAHLSLHGIAHRDLKSNNVLVDISEGADSPHLAISDFGSCLADAHYGLQLPYLTTDTDKGGNSALMAPEIKCAEPGPDCILDYSLADVWAAGTLAYEIFGEVNPFYGGLESRSYREEDLPQLPADVPEVVERLVEAMLKRNPSERPSPAVAATCLELLLWAPPQLSPFSQQLSSNALWRFKEISHWLESLTMETVCQRVFGGGASQLDLQMKYLFLSRVSRQDVFGVVSFEESS